MEKIKKTKKVRMIDPPSGWRYGFPKPIPEDVKNVNDWLIENGYPESEIIAYGEYFACRYWIKDAPDEPIVKESDETPNPFPLMDKIETEFLIFCMERRFEKLTVREEVVYDLSVMYSKFMSLAKYLQTDHNWKKFQPIVNGYMNFEKMVFEICKHKLKDAESKININKA